MNGEHKRDIGTSNRPLAILSEGEWKSLQIPYLEAANFISDARHLIVSLGGELGLTLPFVERYEPKKLGLVFLEENARRDQEGMPRSERLALAELLSQPQAPPVTFSIGDMVGLAVYSLDFARSAQASVTALAIGAKPHALAFGIACLAQDNMEVVCRVPGGYRPLDVQPSGRLYFYEVEDRFEPTAYL